MRKTFYVALEHDIATSKSTKLLGSTEHWAKPKEIIEETLSYLPDASKNEKEFISKTIRSMYRSFMNAIKKQEFYSEPIIMRKYIHIEEQECPCGNFWFDDLNGTIQIIAMNDPANDCPYWIITNS